jgi:thiamine pyrophosphokinase
MKTIVETSRGVTVIGNGSVTRGQITLARGLAPVLVAADGGLRHGLRAGWMPKAVIGDMDSGSRVLAGIPADRIHRIDDQDTTDFEKCLAAIRAPFLLALGVAGSRLDHTLASMSALVGHRGPPAFVLAGRDVILAAPRELSLDLPRGTRVSLFPMSAVGGRSSGLAWPIDGLEFSPSGRVGTSNRATGGPVRLAFDAPGMLVILPVRHLPAVLSAHGLSSSGR